MISFPTSTIVNKRLPKERLFTNSHLSPQLKEIAKVQIESIYWKYKFAETTLGVRTGGKVTEIEVFEIRLHKQEMDRKILSAIAKSIPYKILFICSAGENAQIVMDVEGTFYFSKWVNQSELNLTIAGLDLDSIYSNLAIQLSNNRLKTGIPINIAVAQDNNKLELKRRIVSLQKKMFVEKQFNKQIEISNQVKKLTEELEKLR